VTHMQEATRDDLLKAAQQAPPIGYIDSPQLKRRIWCQGLTAYERGKWEGSFLKGRGSKQKLVTTNARAALIVRCIIKSETDTARLYTEEDAIALGRLPAVIIEPIYDKCRELSGVGEEAAEELEQLSAATTTSDSASS
jgi:hypothetical protein